MKKIRFENKSLFRLYAKKKLSTLGTVYKRDKVISKQLLDIIEALKPRSILMYLPLTIEPDISSVIQICRKKYQVFVPFMEGLSFKMVRYRLPLYVRRFKIREPKNSLIHTKKVDLAIVPVIGVDGALKRIGFGKGMYDRFFDSLDSKPTVICVQRTLCMTSSLLGQQHDIVADIYLTPYHIICQRGYNDLRITSGRSSPNKRRCRLFHRQKDGSSQL